MDILTKNSLKELTLRKDSKGLMHTNKAGNKIIMRQKAKKFVEKWMRAETANFLGRPGKAP